MVDEIIIGNYKLLEKIGEGGMGEVYKAIDLMLEREVALKFMRAEYARQSHIVERFRKEAIALARLNHSNIATLYNFVPYDDTFFMVMEFAIGQTLDRVIAAHKKGMPWQYVLSYFSMVLKGIDHAHQKNIVHRDIKPSNIMLSDRNEIKVLDFGIARLLGSAHLTRPGQTMGTMKYMSPEQIQGKEIDTRSDIYSLGIVLFELLAGHIPFREMGDYALMKAHIEQPAPPLSVFIPDLPEPIESVVRQTLAKDPDDRVQAVCDFLNALEEFIPTIPFTFEGRFVRPPDYSPGSGERPSFSRPDTGSASRNLRKPARPEAVERIPGNNSSPFRHQEMDDQATRIVQRDQESGRKTQRILLPRWRSGYQTLVQSVRNRFRILVLVARKTAGYVTGSVSAGVHSVLQVIRRRLRPLLFILGVCVVVVSSYWAFKPRPLTPEEKAQIELLLNKTENAMAQDRFIAPDKDNAEGYLVQIFNLSPDQPDALRFIEQILNRVLKLSYDSLEQGDIAKAQTYLLEASRLVAEHRLGDDKLAELTRAVNAEQNRLAELERQRKIDEERAAQIAALMEQAESAAAAGNFVQPDENSALAYAEKILQIDSNRMEAREVVANILEMGRARAQENLRNGNIEEAKAFRNKALALAKKHQLPDAKVQSLSNKIDEEEQRLDEEEQRLAEIERRITEEARLAEQQRNAQALVREEKIKALVAKASAALKSNRLITPVRDNAAEYAAEILKLDADNRDAKRVLDDILDQFIQSAGDALSEGDIVLAERQRRAAEQIATEHNLTNAGLEPLAGRIVQQKKIEETRREEEAQLKEARRNEEAQLKEQARRQEEARRKEEARLQDEARLKETARRQEDARLQKEARRTEDARLKEQARRQEEARLQDEARRKEEPRKREIESLVKKAGQALDANRLITPNGQSASDYAGQTLKLDPGNQKATGILKEIVGRLIALGEVALAGGDMSTAEKHERSAESLIKRYGLPDTEYYRFSARMKTAQLEAMAKKQAEMARKQPEPPEVDQPPPEPKKKSTFMPPSF